MKSWDDDFKPNKWEDLFKSIRYNPSVDPAYYEYVKDRAEYISNYREKKGLKDMIYYVKFDGTDKLYAFFCKKNIDFKVGHRYKITADQITTYNNPVTVIRTSNEAPNGVKLRTITYAQCLDVSHRPDDRIEKVIFNREKNTTVVLWKDGQKTKVKCQDGDTFDEEKALALCYMKRVLGNRGSFNETLKKFCTTQEE